MDIEHRIQRLEDIQDIEKLTYQYAAYCDDNYNPDGIANCFTEDGVWVVDGEGGSNNGREEIREHFRQLSQHISWAIHIVTNMRIDVHEDGKSATSHSYLLCFCTIGEDAVVLTLNYTNQFVKQDGKWFFKELRGSTHQVSNWDQGWVKQKFR